MTTRRLFLWGMLALSGAAQCAEPAVEFFRAVEVDDARAVGALLGRGFDPNTLNPKGQLGLYVALRDGSPKVAQALIEHPQTRTDATNTSDETPLMMAALRGNAEATRALLDRGAKLNRAGWTPLHYAASGPAIGVLRLLLDRGAEMEARSPNGTTALMMAARYGDENSVDLLLERGAEVRSTNVQGLNAADFAALAGRDRLAARLRTRTAAPGR